MGFGILERKQVMKPNVKEYLLLGAVSDICFDDGIATAEMCDSLDEARHLKETDYMFGC